MSENLDPDHGTWSDRTFDSGKHGWRSLRLRRHTFFDNQDELSRPPIAEQVIYLQTNGVYDVEMSLGGHWQSPARSMPGTLSVIAPQVSFDFRLRRSSPEPIETVELFLPTATTERLTAELWDRDARHVAMPDILSTSNPILEAGMYGLIRTVENGLPELYAEMAVEFLTVHTLVHHAKFPTPVIRRDDRRIRMARTFLRENLHLPVSLPELAAEVGMSRYHLIRVFQRETGETPYQYLTRLRVEQAKRDLTQSSRSITDIAMQAGFSTPAYFATAFRRATGLSPSAFRESQRRVRYK